MFKERMLKIMPMIASIVVLSGTYATAHTTYDYLVPKAYCLELEVGMRVAIPFGRGNKLLTGLVIALSDLKDLERSSKKLKAIAYPLDVTPTLSRELIDLAHCMPELTFAYLSACVEVMIPNVLKSESRKVIQPTPHCSSSLKQQWFSVSLTLDWQEAVNKAPLHYWKKLQDEAMIEIRYQMKQKRYSKEVWMWYPAYDLDKYQEILPQISSRAKQQQALMHYIQTHYDKTWQSIQKSNISVSVWKRAQELGWIQLKKQSVYRDPLAHMMPSRTEPLSLNKEQRSALTEIKNSISSSTHTTFLLEGITGSGKTEVYLQAILAVLEKGQKALLLVPEIGLTPQMITRVKSRFDRVAVWHSGLNDGEKYDTWQRIQKGEIDVVVGVRSAIFLPIEDLGIIILDEEHDASYKQDDLPRYHARDIALWRAKYHQIPLILGSATPSLETKARAEKGLYKPLYLTQRAHQFAYLPQTELIDLKQVDVVDEAPMFSLPLMQQMIDTLEKQEQMILLINRRGSAQFMQCRSCGTVLHCPHCSISLTVHEATQELKCHYCTYHYPIPKACPFCHQPHLRTYGLGTQKVEQALTTLFPNETILRMDVDTMRKKHAYEQVLSAFEAQEASILIGTQMVAKGLDFPNVTLVGVLNADTSLYLPDFRASERTFQLITQVSGRAGRADKKGTVMIQTYHPEHYAIQAAKDHDYSRFFKEEMYWRHIGGYAPYYYLVQCHFSHPNEREVARWSYKATHLLKEELDEQSILLGPSPAGITKRQDRYYYQCLMKYKKEPHLWKRLQAVDQYLKEHAPKGFYFSIDKDPLYFI